METNEINIRILNKELETYLSYSPLKYENRPDARPEFPEVWTAYIYSGDLDDGIIALRSYIEGQNDWNQFQQLFVDGGIVGTHKPPFPNLPSNYRWKIKKLTNGFYKIVNCGFLPIGFSLDHNGTACCVKQMNTINDDPAPSGYFLITRC